MAVMRTSLWPGLIEAMRHNLNRQQSRVRLFESGLTFVPGNGDLSQEPMLSGVITGRRAPESWSEEGDSVDYYDMKGDLEALLALSGPLDQYSYQPASHAALHPGQSAEIRRNGEVVGLIGAIHPLLQKQLDAQDREVATLRSSIANATVIERQMVPLMMRMLDGLEEFIDLDVPFLLEEREERVANLRALMERADLTVAEKSRRVFEAFQIENDYGRTLEAYKGKLDLGDRSYDVDFLRIGRLALLYRSVGNDRFGHWDRQSEQWVETDESQFRRNVDKGLRIAGQEMAPELVTIPIPPAVEVQP